MRLTTVTIAFIFFGTVFATPIYPLRGNAVELSKRADQDTTMTGLGEDESAPGPATAPTRGRSRTRGASSGSIRGGKGKLAQLREGEASTSRSPKRKASGDGEVEDEGRSRSASKRRRGCDPDLVTKEEFLEALRHIQQTKPAGQGSQGLAVYHITVPVKECTAVVKIIDDRLALNVVRKEVAGLRQVKQLLGWGTRAKPKLNYVLMRNMGVPLNKVTGLDATRDAAFIEKKKAAALKLHADEYHLQHTDPEGNGNYLWYINEGATEMEDRYQVNVVDWADATKIGPDGTEYAKAPAAIVIPDEKAIYAPTESPESSKKGSNTPPSNSDGEQPQVVHTGSTGKRSSGRLAAKNTASTSGTSGHPQ